MVILSTALVRCPWENLTKPMFLLTGLLTALVTHTSIHWVISEFPVYLCLLIFSLDPTPLSSPVLESSLANSKITKTHLLMTELYHCAHHNAVVLLWVSGNLACVKWCWVAIYYWTKETEEMSGDERKSQRKGTNKKKNVSKMNICSYPSVNKKAYTVYKNKYIHMWLMHSFGKEKCSCFNLH